MPSLIISGHPATGKTTFTTLLTSRALSHPSISKVINISESTSCQLPKSSCYASSHAEKETRASLKSSFDTAVTNNTASKTSNETLVILDSLNYIKGYRYELYCISKAAGQRHGVIWIQGSKSDEARKIEPSPSDLLAKQRNKDRVKEEEGDYYQPRVMEELVARYEPPDDRNRWENPLYKVDVSSLLPWDENGTLIETKLDSDQNVMQQLQQVRFDDAPKKVVKSASGFKRNKRVKPKAAAASAVVQPTSESSVQAPSGPMSMAARNLSNASSATTDDVSSPRSIEETIDSILNSFLSIKPLKEGMSTANHASAESDVLNVVDSVTQRVNIEILRVQKHKSDTESCRLTINIGKGEVTLKILRQLNNTELRNLRTQFLKWTASHPSSGKEEEIVLNYIRYIESVVGNTDR